MQPSRRGPTPAVARPAGRGAAAAPSEPSEPSEPNEPISDAPFTAYIRLACAEYERVLARCAALEAAGVAAAGSAGRGDPAATSHNVGGPSWNEQRGRLRSADSTVLATSWAVSACKEEDAASGFGEEEREQVGGDRGPALEGDPPRRLSQVLGMGENSLGISKMSSQLAGRPKFGAGAEETAERQLRDFFQQCNPGATASSEMRNVRHRSATQDDHPIGELSRSQGNMAKKFLNQFVVHPRSRTRIAFGVGTVLICLYDVVMLPAVLAFEIESTPWSWAMAVAALAFWLSIMIHNFFHMYYDGGALVTDLTLTSRRYLRGGFAVDASVNFVDFLTLVLEFWMGRNVGNVMMRVLPNLRVCRLFRVFVILRRFRHEFENAFDNPSMAIMGYAFRLVGIVFLLNHGLCCGWIRIGRSGLTDTGFSWLDLQVAGNNLLYKDFSYSYIYFSALHWSMTQMTPGSMAVVPLNSLERVYNVVCLVIGLFFSAMLMAQFSSRMIRISMLNQEQMQQVSQMNQFLIENNVSWALTKRIEIQCKERQMNKKRVTEKDVPGLSVLSITLRQELAYAIFSGPLRSYTLFFVWDVSEPECLIQMCSAAVETTVASTDDDVFAPFLPAKKTYYLCEGDLEYEHNIFQETQNVSRMTSDPKALDEFSLRLRVGSWISTVALWLNWTYRGTLTARQTSKLMTIRAQDMCEVLRHYPQLLATSRGYARAFSRVVLDERVQRQADVDVDPAHVLMALPLNVRVDVMRRLLKCLHDQSKMRISTGKLLQGHGSRLHSASTRNKDRLEKEVEDGKCILLIGPKGSVFRSVLLVVLRIAKLGGFILVRIAKRGRGNNNVQELAIGLPGGKLREGETEAETTQRLMSTQLASIASNLVLHQVEHVTETLDSSGYGILTVYKKTILHAQLTAVDPSNSSISRRSTGVEAMSANDTMRTAEPAKRRVVAIPAPEWLVVLDEDGQETLYAWLYPDEFAQLSEVPQDDVRFWLESVNAPSYLNAATKDGGFCSEVPV